ncbi:MAG TPA: dienelactone hydrolase family protein [Aggregatilineales bacterium]|nr:dienelactone hydrolase family protein [Aggregatilineales bacterium]
MIPDAQPEPQVITSGAAFDALGLVHRMLLPRTGAPPFPTLVMIHGYLGDENVTWVFARSAGPEWLIVSMRAPFASPEGNRWYYANDDGSVNADEYAGGLDALSHFIDALPGVYPVDRDRLVLLGFSQGAAMAYAYALRQRVSGVASLSGFIARPVPRDLPPLHGLPVLILHGTEDTTIPIRVARANRARLLAAGADVTYRESDIGHKVSAEGMRDLQTWLAARLEP